jgi:branched-chain amino acid transport system permease protein
VRALRSSKTIFLVFLILTGAAAVFQDSFNQYYLQVVIYIGVNVILATSLNLINGYTGQFSLGHAGFMAIGAYASTVVTRALPPAAGTPGGEGVFFVALLAAGIAASIAGLLVGVPSFRLRGDYLAITTLGFGEIIRVFIQNISFLGGARGMNGIPKMANLFWVLSAAGLAVFVVTNLVNSSYGKGFLAVRDDEIAAQAMGVNPTRYKIIAFVTGAFFAGIAGGLYAHFVMYINPAQFSFIKSIEIVVMVIIGGMGSTVGVIIAAILLTILPEALRSIAEYRMIIYSLLLIVIMISRPQGLFGKGIDFRSWFNRKAVKGASAR